MRHHTFCFFCMVMLWPGLAPLFAQTVFSEKALDYKKAMLPYDMPYTIGLPDKQFVMLQELKKNTMKLGRYDQYFLKNGKKKLSSKKMKAFHSFFCGEIR